MLSGLFTTDVLSFVELERIRSPNWEPFRALLETSETYELFNKAHVTPETSSKVSESQPKGTQRVPPRWLSETRRKRAFDNKSRARKICYDSTIMRGKKQRQKPHRRKREGRKSRLLSRSVTCLSPTTSPLKEMGRGGGRHAPTSSHHSLKAGAKMSSCSQCGPPSSW